MTELLEAVASWKSLLLVLFVFGFAPRLVLRLLVRIYPKDDPRREDLLADLAVTPRLEKPLKVAEHLETALSEGVPLRIRSLRSERPESDIPVDSDQTEETSTVQVSKRRDGPTHAGRVQIKGRRDGLTHAGQRYWWDGRAKTLCGENFTPKTFTEPILYGVTTCASCRSGVTAQG